MSTLAGTLSAWRAQLRRRHAGSAVIRVLVYAAAAASALTLVFLVAYILIMGVVNLRPELFSPVYNTDNHSMLPAIVNTVLMTVYTLVLAVPVGVFAGVYMTEYAKPGSRVVRVIRVATETLQGIPSVVFGLFGFLMLVIFLKLDYSLLAGCITLALMVLPVIIRTTEEALLAVPQSYREASFGLGAGRLRTVFRVVLPAAVPGILAGVILAIGKIVGETAALVFTAGAGTGISWLPTMSGRTLAVHMYLLLNEGLYMDAAYATGAVLLFVVLGINLLSRCAAKKLSKNTR